MKENKTKQESKHTPWPWEAQGSRVLAPRPGERRLHDGSIQNDVDTLVAKARRPTDARFIVKAANNHDRMVEALKRIHDEADHTVGTEAYSSEVAVSNAKTIRRIAKDALATVEDEA